MKAFILLFLVFTIHCFAVCNDPISRNNELPRPTSAGFNGDLNSLFAHLNTVLGDCINDNSITTNQFPDNGITSIKFADASVTIAKLATGVIPSFGKPLRIKAYTSSGTWIKQPDVGAILVQLVGGSGAVSSVSASAGTQSSFGSHCIAYGGNPSIALSGGGSTIGSGGSAASGDVLLTGGVGQRANIKPVARGGSSMLGPFGRGASQVQGTGGGGAGGFCMKVIAKELLADSESVVVGSAGVNLSGNGNSGVKGLVIVYEYGR